MDWIFGLSLITAGAGVVLQTAWQFRKNYGIRLWSETQARWVQHKLQAARDSEATVAREVSEESRIDLFEPGSFQEAIEYKGIPLRQSGADQHYDLEILGKMLAWLIYSRLVPGISGRVGSPYNPTMFNGRVDDNHKLGRFLWTRVFIDESICQTIRSYYNLDAAELDKALKVHLLSVLESFLSDSCHQTYGQRLVVNIFESNFKQATSFDVDFLPLLPDSDDPLCCDAYLLLGSGLGQVAMPGSDCARIQFTDQEFGLRQGYFPLHSETGSIIEVGPHPSSHIQTHKQFCAGKLTLGWRESSEMGVGGILEVRLIEPGKHESFSLRHGESRLEEQLRAGTKTRLTTTEEGKQTTCEIWRRRGQESNLLLSLVMRNRKPPLDSLPDCSIFEDAFSEIPSELELARFLACQIYFATKRRKNEGGLFWLASDEGQSFFNDPSSGGAIFSHGRKREPLRSRVKICVSPARLDMLHEWLGDRDMTSNLAQRVLDLIREEPGFHAAYPPETLPAFEPGEGTPGLTIEVGSDTALDANTILIRCLPIFVPNRRREIYGRFYFEKWSGAQDRSDFSCKQGLTFFTDYPSGMVALHLSRFSVYEIQAPQIFGAIKIHVIEPGTASARLKIDNHSSATIEVNGKPLHRPASATIELAARTEQECNLVLGDRRASIRIYKEPLAQLDEPHFVPEPAKLELYGLTLHRRLERTGWQSARPFLTLWDAANIHENKELLGVSQVTSNGFLTVLERGIEIQHHLFAGTETHITKPQLQVYSAQSNSLEEAPLGCEFKLWEKETNNVQVDYFRQEFRRHPIINASVLTTDYYEHWIEKLERLLPEGERVERVELARCGAGGAGAHLYLLETRGHEGSHRGWLWHEEGGIQAVTNRGIGRIPLKLEGPLVGPLNDIRGKLYHVDWQAEQGTPVSFDVEDHEDQVNRYLSDGFFSLSEDAPYKPGGKLADTSNRYKSQESLYISGSELHLHDESSGTSSRRCLNFNPREYANFFDKESYKIAYSGVEQSFVIVAEAHHKDSITPKTVFMVIPEGGHAILGSHALSPVKIPAGINYIVLPGLTFKFSQGPVYYE